MTAAVATAQAHTHLEGSVPADKSRVKAPAAIELHFSEAAKLTALKLQKGKEAEQPIKALPAKAAANVSVPVPALSEGDYVVSWRVVGDDGHVMSGKFAFTVDPSAPAAATKPAMHDGMKMDDHDRMDHMKATDGKKAAGAGDPHQH
jgi:methionine-rich copper-binding protein CopC